MRSAGAISRAIGLAIGLVTLAGGSALAQRGAATTVILVRHAENAAMPANDPPLTAAGEARARGAVRKHAGHTVLVVGHSNAVPAIIEALGAKRPRDICDSVYDDLFVVTIPASGKPALIRGKYGVRTPADSACATMMR